MKSIQLLNTFLADFFYKGHLKKNQLPYIYLKKRISKERQEELIIFRLAYCAKLLNTNNRLVANRLILN